MLKLINNKQLFKTTSANSQISSFNKKHNIKRLFPFFHYYFIEGNMLWFISCDKGTLDKSVC